MSAASDYLRQQVTLAASKLPIVTFVSCQRSLAPSGPSHEDGIGLATFGWGPNGWVHKDASGNPNGLGFGIVYQWFSDRTVVGQYPHDFPPEWQYFRGGSGLPAHQNSESLSLDFTLQRLRPFRASPFSSPVTWAVGDTVVRLDVVLSSWRTSTTPAPTWSVTTSVVDGRSQQLVFSIPGSFKIPGAGAAQRGAPPAVMLVSFNPQGEYGWE